MEKCVISMVTLMLCCLYEVYNSCTSEKTCPTDCSQQIPRSTDDTVFFNCSVGAKKDVERYRKTHAAEFLPKSTIFDAPTIRGVELYWKSYDNNLRSVPAMKFKFSLPEGKTYEKSECVWSPCWRLPKAVLLTYESIPGPYEDSYYINCSIEKIFEFQFLPILPYDITNPRQLMDDCFVGLDELKDKLVYNITLQTAEGKGASYITTVKVRPISSQLWSPVIMTYLNETEGILYTVIEKPPSTHNIQSYNVSLVVGENRILRSTKIMLPTTNATQFENLTRGQYKIKVRPLCKESCNKTVNFATESYRIDAHILLRDDYPRYLEESLEPMTIVAMVIGCIFGVLLLPTITYCLCQRPKCQDNCSEVHPSGILLHPFEKECEAIIKLKQYISQACDCTVADCMDLHPESELEPDNTTSDSVEKCLKDNTFVLVLYASGCYNNSATSFDTDFYSCFLKSAINHKQRHNDIRIVPLKLPFNASSDLPSVISKKSTRPVKVLDSPEKVYCRIHGLAKDRRKRKNLHSTNLSHWRDMWIGLSQIFGHIQKTQRDFEPLFNRTDNVNKHTVQDIQEYHEEVLKPSAKDYFKQIAMFNEETDSVIGSLNRKSHKTRVRPSQEYKDNSVGRHTFDNGKTQFKGKHDESELLLESRKENIEQPEGHTCATGKNKPSNIQMFRAEVHYSSKRNIKSSQFANERPAVNQKDQPVFLPTHIPCQSRSINTMQQITRRKLEFENHLHHYREKGNHSAGRSEFNPVMNFNMDHSDLEDNSIDGSAMEHVSETENSQDIYFTDTYQRSPWLHGNLHHRPFFNPYGVLGHRNPGHPETSNHSRNGFHDFQQDHLFDHNNIHCKGNEVSNNHCRPDISDGMTHQQISNRVHYDSHYQPDDFMCYRDTFPMDHIGLPDYDQEDFPDHYHHLHQNHQENLPNSAKHLNVGSHHQQSMHD